MHCKITVCYSLLLRHGVKRQNMMVAVKCTVCYCLVMTNLRLSAGLQTAPYNCSSLLVWIWAPSLVFLLGLDGHQMDQSSRCQRRTLLGQRGPPRQGERSKDHITNEEFNCGRDKRNK